MKMLYLNLRIVDIITNVNKKRVLFGHFQGVNRGQSWAKSANFGYVLWSIRGCCRAMMTTCGQDFSSIWPYLLPPNPLKWVQLVYETKNMMGFFRVKSKTASSQAVKLGMFKLWKNPDSTGYVKVFVDPLTLPKSDNFCQNTGWGKALSALTLPVVKNSSKLDCI